MRIIALFIVAVVVIFGCGENKKTVNTGNPVSDDALSSNVSKNGKGNKSNQPGPANPQDEGTVPDKPAGEQPQKPGKGEKEPKPNGDQQPGGEPQPGTEGSEPTSDPTSPDPEAPKPPKGGGKKPKGEPKESETEIDNAGSGGFEGTVGI